MNDIQEGCQKCRIIRMIRAGMPGIPSPEGWRVAKVLNPEADVWYLQSGQGSGPGKETG
jgi:hypothetical protein